MLTQLRQEYNDVKRDYEAELAKYEEIETSLKNYINQRDITLNRRKEKKQIYLERQKNNKYEIKQLNDVVDSLCVEDVDQIKVNLTTLEGQLSTCDIKISEYVESISADTVSAKHIKEQYKKIGTDADNCPVCLRPIKDHDKANIKAEKQQLKADIDALVSCMKASRASLDKVKQVKLKVQESISSNTSKLTETKLIGQKKDNTLERINQLKGWQAELEVDLKQVEDVKTDFDSIIDETQLRIDNVNTKITAHRQKISKLDIVKYVVSEEGVKSYIVQKLLDLLNNKLLHYLRKLDSNSICIFNEYFEEEILNEKNKVCSYFNFSGAERKSIDLACLFTFSDIRRMQGGVKYNIAIYDELFDSSFDEKGIELITEILQDRVKELNECSIVISHRKESIKAVTGDVIYLEKTNGITRRIDYAES